MLGTVLVAFSNADIDLTSYGSDRLWIQPVMDPTGYGSDRMWVDPTSFGSDRIRIRSNMDPTEYGSDLYRCASVFHAGSIFGRIPICQI